MGIFKKLKEKLFGKISQELKADLHKSQPAKTKPSNGDLNLQKAKQKIIAKEQAKISKNTKVDKFITGLKKTNDSFSSALLKLQSEHAKIDEDYFDDLEEILVMADVSVKLTQVLVNEIKKTIKIENISDPKMLNEVIVDKMFLIYANQEIIDNSLNYQQGRLNVFMMIGVNGSGKTTSIAKIADKFIKEGKKVLIAAGDTFRAAATDQLQVWAQRVKADIMIAQHKNQDPASVVYSALEKAQTDHYDLLIIDTAGRLQNKVNLMNELEKINRVIKKFLERPADEILLVLDATTGQNGISQAKHFNEVAEVSGIILTKMDGTSKGGIVLSIKNEFNINVKFVGLGEKTEDLQEFDLDIFIYAMTRDLIERSGNA